MPQEDNGTWRQDYYDENAPELLGGARRAQRALDRLIRWFSGGALALSVGFFHQIESPPSISVTILNVGWIFLLLSIVSVFFSLKTMENAYERELVLVQQVRDGEIERPRDEPNCWDRWTGRLNSFSMWTAIPGVIAVLVFAWMNLG